MGVLALFASLLVLLLLPLINTSAVRSSLYRPLYQKFFWFLVADFFLLSYLGQARRLIAERTSIGRWFWTSQGRIRWGGLFGVRRSWDGRKAMI